MSFIASANLRQAGSGLIRQRQAVRVDCNLLISLQQPSRRANQFVHDLD